MWKSLKEDFANIKINLTEKQEKCFNDYSDFLVQYNEKVNLTRITEKNEIDEKHFFDSVLPFSMIELKENSIMIDVGTGAGFPGVPIKIIREDIKLTLLDSLEKRTLFLKELSKLLNQDNKIIHGRAEQIGIDKEYREKYDYAVSRAVANLASLCEYCLPFVKVGGYFISLKGPSPEEEIEKAKNAITILGGNLIEVKKYTLPNGDGRSLVIIKKEKAIDKKYPRQRIKISEKPL